MIEIHVIDPKKEDITCRVLNTKPIRIGDNPEYEIPTKDIKTPIEIGHTKYGAIYVKSLNPRDGFNFKHPKSNHFSKYLYFDIIVEKGYEIQLHRGITSISLKDILSDKEFDRAIDESEVIVKIQ